MKTKKFFDVSKNNWIAVITLLSILVAFLLLYKRGMLGAIPNFEISASVGVGCTCLIISLFFDRKKDFWLYWGSAIICYVLALIYIDSPMDKIICGGIFLFQIALWIIYKRVSNRLLKHS